MKKSVFALAMALALCLGVAACNDDSDDDNGKSNGNTTSNILNGTIWVHDSNFGEGYSVMNFTESTCTRNTDNIVETFTYKVNGDKVQLYNNDAKFNGPKYMEGVIAGKELRFSDVTYVLYFCP